VSNAAAERRIFAEELTAATPYLAGRSIRERLAIARQVESVVARALRRRAAESRSRLNHHPMKGAQPWTTTLIVV
jgi:hypothetical protein